MTEDSDYVRWLSVQLPSTVVFIGRMLTGQIFYHKKIYLF